MPFLREEGGEGGKPSIMPETLGAGRRGGGGGDWRGAWRGEG